MSHQVGIDPSHIPIEWRGSVVMRRGRLPQLPTTIGSGWCWCINANMTGVYWWDPWSTNIYIYSSTMDPMGIRNTWLPDFPTSQHSWCFLAFFQICSHCSHATRLAAMGVAMQAPNGVEDMTSMHWRSLRFLATFFAKIQWKILKILSWESSLPNSLSIKPKVLVWFCGLWCCWHVPCFTICCNMMRLKLRMWPHFLYKFPSFLLAFPPVCVRIHHWTCHLSATKMPWHHANLGGTLPELLRHDQWQKGRRHGAGPKN